MATTLAQVLATTRARLQTTSSELARTSFRASTELEQGMSCAAHIRQFSFAVDEPAALGGAETGPTPVELVLAALGTCQEIVYALYAALEGVALQGVRVEVTGELDPRGLFDAAPVPPGFAAVHYHVQIDSGADPDTVARLVETVDRHCPVLDILRRPVPVTRQTTLNGSPLTVD